jgi:hypothetical protein
LATLNGAVWCRVIVENCAKLYESCLFDSRFPALFTVDFTASLLGMFELNCLGITVESPVEDLRDEIRTTKKRDGSLGVNAELKEHFRMTEGIFKMLGSTDVPCDVRSSGHLLVVGMREPIVVGSRTMLVHSARLQCRRRCMEAGGRGGEADMHTLRTHASQACVCFERILSCG